MSDPIQITEASETKRALASLKNCPGWTEWLRPRFEKERDDLAKDILEADDLTAEGREQKRAAYKAIKDLLAIEANKEKWADSVLREKSPARSTVDR